jgi:hypothetical protein
MPESNPLTAARDLLAEHHQPIAMSHGEVWQLLARYQKALQQLADHFEEEVDAFVQILVNLRKQDLVTLGPDLADLLDRMTRDEAVAALRGALAADHALADHALASA